MNDTPNSPIHPQTSQGEGAAAESQLPAMRAETPPVAPEALERYVSGMQSFAERIGVGIDRFTQYLLPRNLEEEKAPENIARGPILLGLFIFFMVFIVFGIWSAIAPIDSAAIAPGKVTLDSNRKTIDHLEGGIVKEIVVREGQVVKLGDPLVELDDTAAKARRDLYLGQYVAALATESRLLAERDNLDEITFPTYLTKQLEKTQVAQNIDSQKRLFASRRESLEGQTEVLQKQIQQSEEEINGLHKQIASANSQLALLADEIKDVEYLLRSGNAAKTRLLALKRRRAEIQGSKGERTSMIARAQQRINEAKIQMFNLKTEFRREVSTDLRDTQVQLSDLEEQLRAAEDVMKRIVIRAPIAGQVTGLSAHTRGGVIAPDEPIMDIVPSDDKLIVEARIKPQDIDVVRPGLLARVRLLAFKVRNVPPVEGEVVTVSADRFDDDRTGESYFTARIEIDEEQLARLDNVKLSPGMPTEALIVTGSRSFFAYLMSPINSSFNRAFREQ